MFNSQNRERASALFHQLWGRSKDGSPYEKRLWSELHLLLTNAGAVNDPNRHSQVEYKSTDRPMLEHLDELRKLADRATRGQSWGIVANEGLEAAVDVAVKAYNALPMLFDVIDRLTESNDRLLLEISRLSGERLSALERGEEEKS